MNFGNIIFVSDIWDVIHLYFNSWHMRSSCFCSLVCTSYHNHFRQHHLYNPLSHHRLVEESGIYHYHNGILFLCILEQNTGFIDKAFNVKEFMTIKLQWNTPSICIGERPQEKKCDRYWVFLMMSQMCIIFLFISISLKPDKEQIRTKNIPCF